MIENKPIQLFTGTDAHSTTLNFQALQNTVNTMGAEIETLKVILKQLHTQLESITGDSPKLKTALNK